MSFNAFTNKLLGEAKNNFPKWKYRDAVKIDFGY